MPWKVIDMTSGFDTSTEDLDTLIRYIYDTYDFRVSRMASAALLVHDSIELMFSDGGYMRRLRIERIVR